MTGDYTRDVRATRFVMIAFLCGCTAGDDVPAPRIASVSPDHGGANTQVTIEGDYFCQQPETGGEDPLACANTGIVTFGQTPGTVGMYTEQTITAEVPALEAGTYAIAVSVAGRRSNTVQFTVEAP
jgi:hypothetical protein